MVSQTLANTFFKPANYLHVESIQLVLPCNLSKCNWRNEFLTSWLPASFFLMSVVIFCYSRVYYAIRQHNCAVRVPSLQGANNSQGTVRTLEIKTSRVLFAAVFGFFVCWTSFTLILILEFGFNCTLLYTVDIPVILSFESEE